MSNYHLSVKGGVRGMGAKHARYVQREGHYAYISREGKFQERGDLALTESGNMPAWARNNPNAFWEAADLYERANGRIYTEIEVSIPRELSDDQRVELIREFVANTLGERHAYTWAIHNPKASDGLEQPHAHTMFTERVNDGIARDPQQFFRRFNPEHPEKGGAGKDRSMRGPAFVREVREEWAMTANHFLARAGIEVRIDHRSYKTLGIELEASLKVGIARHAGERGVMAGVLAENRARARRNGERLLVNPAIGIHALTATQSVFSRRDIEQFVFRNTDGEEQFRQVYARLMNSKELQALRDGGRQGEWFASTELREIEARLVERAQAMSRAGGTASGDDVVRARLRATRQFNAGQDAAFVALAGGGQLVVVNGAAGTGKSYVLAAAREALEADGMQVIGAALQGKTADDMQRDAGIASRTLHSLLSGIERGAVTLDQKTVLVIDEAGMVGSRQLEKLLGHAQAAGARVRLVGDAWQLHAVDAGDAFRAVSREAAVANRLESLTEIKRQNHGWQRDASLALAQHDVSTALNAYGEHGDVQLCVSVAAAREQLLAQWQADRQANPDGTQLLLTHTNAQREALNAGVRELRKAAGELGAEQLVSIATSASDGKPTGRQIAIAAGERIMFLQNEYAMQVKNGTLATVERIETHADKSASDVVLHVRLDDGRRLAVDTGQYGHFDHGYALTIHKSQGVTVDRAYVLATKTMHAELAYVAMTRHKESLVVAAGRDEFADGAAMIRSLSRADDKSFSAQHTVLAARDRQPELGYRHTLGQRRVAFSNAPRLQRQDKTLVEVVRPYTDALAAETLAKQAGKPVPAKDRAALKRAQAGLARFDAELGANIRQLVVHDDRAWKALVELSGESRARMLVNQVREVREAQARQAAGYSMRADERAVGLAMTKAAVSRKPFAELTQQEKAARRAEYLQEQRRKASVDHSRGRSNPEVHRSKSDYGLE
ncbi:exonuclease V subunit alpha [Caballeronia calidae]|uniref:Exonuclease V subunit alpha n=1 Tax=Caballeronia calidae TaxID=1777139 RepID=A0A158EIY7_9BURK|nr:AAA family ATPase [Caballeronia calidae]SAL06690.1 exonuclease V subunit alpha [Caballeronia calidae]